jgi:hypothetical protein
MKPNPEFTGLDQWLLQMRCHCGRFPRLMQETLFTDPPIVTFFYSCQCGNRTGNFEDQNQALACWRQRYTWPAKIQKNT